MFVSSYSTYIGANNSQKFDKDRVNKSSTSTKTFDSTLAKSVILEAKDTKDLSIDYISNYKSFNNKQKLGLSLNNNDTQVYTKTKAKQSAQIAYTENSKLFSFLIKPSISLNQTPRTDKSLAQNIQDIQENNKRNEMVNTYLANDKYYQITA